MDNWSTARLILLGVSNFNRHHSYVLPRLYSDPLVPWQRPCWVRLYAFVKGSVNYHVPHPLIYTFLIFCFRLSKEDFYQLSQTITEMFPSELKETYYVPGIKTVLPKGKLYDAYKNHRTRFRIAGVIPIRNRVKPKPKNCTFSLGLRQWNN